MPNPPAQPTTFLVPSSTGNLLCQGEWKHCQNLHLLLHRYVPHEAIRESSGTVKRDWLTELARRSASGSLFDRELHDAWLRRWTRLADARQALRFTARCTWRMVVGLGNASPMETNLLTHAIYGIPYIPGSALKGLTSAYVRSVDDATDLPHDGAAAAARIFGSNDEYGDGEAGSVVFFDAIPERPVKLEVDIMNPHYPAYYRDSSGQIPPTSDQNPIPVYFLTLSRTAFNFAVAARSVRTSHDDLAQAASWLGSALEQLGIGAKTSAGYGYFHPGT